MGHASSASRSVLLWSDLTKKCITKNLTVILQGTQLHGYDPVGHGNCYYLLFTEMLGLKGVGMPSLVPG